MNKNWGDRADKDLFFTILSVKNIGVISGAEWTTIGNHMRTLGYGFTNEGCRQHFQGLRRAQHKAESNGSTHDSQRTADPTQNPITRRPGPGRGRPRKQPPAPSSSPNDASTGGPVGGSSAASGPAAPLPTPSQAQTPGQASEAQPPTAADSVNMPASDHVRERDSLEMEHDDTNLEEQPSKRQRLADNSNARDSSRDEAVLALIADGLPGPDHYGSSEYYGEA
ncbi:hypothetical protein F4778DRAFT_766532 [Xylariomycetidae sp. FL2044]|nr:hypothetical protein F4778DRAFT_766532 [Xylariomycetidae sp. FL2044]